MFWLVCKEDTTSNTEGSTDRRKGHRQGRAEWPIEGIFYKAMAMLKYFKNADGD